MRNSGCCAHAPYSHWCTLSILCTFSVHILRNCDYFKWFLFVVVKTFRRRHVERNGHFIRLVRLVNVKRWSRELRSSDTCCPNDRVSHVLCLVQFVVRYSAARQLNWLQNPLVVYISYLCFPLYLMSSDSWGWLLVGRSPATHGGYYIRYLQTTSHPRVKGE